MLLSCAPSLIAIVHQRPYAEARLAHCWAMIERLNADAAHANGPRES